MVQSLSDGKIVIEGLPIDFPRRFSSLRKREFTPEMFDDICKSLLDGVAIATIASKYGFYRNVVEYIFHVYCKQLRPEAENRLYRKFSQTKNIPGEKDIPYYEDEDDYGFKDFSNIYYKDLSTSEKLIFDKL